MDSDDTTREKKNVKWASPNHKSYYNLKPSSRQNDNPSVQHKSYHPSPQNPNIPYLNIRTMKLPYP